MKKEIIVFTKNGKYCSNTQEHILGTLPCCEGLVVNYDTIDIEDVVIVRMERQLL